MPSKIECVVVVNKIDNDNWAPMPRKQIKTRTPQRHHPIILFIRQQKSNDMDEYGEDNQSWYRRCKNLHEELKHQPRATTTKRKAGGNSNGNADKDTISYRENLQALLITSHVGKMANLECARMNAAAAAASASAAEATGKGLGVSASVESLTELIEWNQTRIEPYYITMADITNPTIIGGSDGNSTTKSDTGGGTSTTNTKEDFVDELIKQSTVTSIDMDAFFHEYPHCQRSDVDGDEGSTLSSSSSSSSCSSSSDEEDGRKNKKKKKKMRKMRKKRKKTKSTTVDHEDDNDVVTEAEVKADSRKQSTTTPRSKVSTTIGPKVPSAAPAPPVHTQSENIVNNASANQQHHQQQTVSVSNVGVGNGVGASGAADRGGGRGGGVDNSSRRVLQQQPQPQHPEPPLQNGPPSQYDKSNNSAAFPIDLTSNTTTTTTTTTGTTHQHQAYGSGQINNRQQPQQQPHSSIVQNPYSNISRKRNTSTNHISNNDFQQNRPQDNPFQTAKEFKSPDDQHQHNDYNNSVSGGGHHRNQNPYQQRPPHHQHQQNGRGGYDGRNSSRNSSSYNAYGMDPPTLDYQHQHHHHHHHHHNNNLAPASGGGSESHFDYGGKGFGDPSTEIIGGGPYIPQSLQQPFKIPKRPTSSSGTNNSNTNNKTSSSDRRPMMKPNGQIAMKLDIKKSGNVNNKSRGVRPSSSGSGGGGGGGRSNGHGSSKSSGEKNINKSKNGGGDDDDEELPEELQHLEKDLVQKIKNEILDNGEAVTFDDIAGLHGAKKIISEVVCWPMKRPELFHGLRRVSNGLLLYGPPGTGKTLIGKAIAHESGATFFSISSSSLTSKWIGESEKLVRTMFAVAAYEEPSVVFIDEIDSLLTQRKASENEASRRIKTEFLVQLDGTGTAGQGRVLVIGATNRPQELDEAARRRFVNRLYIPLPNESDRKALIKIMVAKVDKHGLSESDLDRLARKTDGYSGADLKNLCQDAAMVPMRLLIEELGGVEGVDENEVPPLVLKHFKTALKKNKPSVSPDDLVQYIEWTKLYGTLNESTPSQLSQDDDDDDDW